MPRHYCPICTKGDDSWGGTWTDTRAVYIRLPGKGFVRVGTLYLSCQHVYIFPEAKLPKA